MARRHFKELIPARYPFTSPVLPKDISAAAGLEPPTMWSIVRWHIYPTTTPRHLFKEYWYQYFYQWRIQGKGGGGHRGARATPAKKNMLKSALNSLKMYWKTGTCPSAKKKLLTILFKKKGNEIFKHCFCDNGSFKTATRDLAHKDKRALFKLDKSFGIYTPSVKTLLHLFDATIQPILLYGSEMWGANEIEMKKILQIKTGLYYKNDFEKYTFNVVKLF